MNEIYWLTRLDAVIEVSIFIIVAVCLAIVGIFANCSIDGEWDMFKKYIKRLTITGFMALLVLLFVPSTKEAMMIYGLGRTLEYIQSSDEAKELPDNVIKALNKWLEEEEKE